MKSLRRPKGKRRGRPGRGTVGRVPTTADEQAKKKQEAVLNAFVYIAREVPAGHCPTAEPWEDLYQELKDEQAAVLEIFNATAKVREKRIAAGSDNEAPLCDLLEAAVLANETTPAPADPAAAASEGSEPHQDS